MLEINCSLILYWASALSPIVGFVAYFIVVENVPRQNHFIFAYLVICFFADAFSYFRILPAPIMSNLHDICQFLIVTMIYVHLLRQRGTFFLAITILLYVVAETATTITIGLNVYQNYMWAFSGFLLSVLCIVYLNVVNVKPKEFAENTDIYNTLLMNASFLFYFLATFLLFVFADWIMREMSTDMMRMTWAFHNSIGLIKNIGLAVAIFLTGKAKVVDSMQTKKVGPMIVDSNPEASDKSALF